MRTKTLLIAAAALVAGVISSEAQTVYSVNVAGYVTVSGPANKYVMVANPLTTGSDVLTNVLHGLPGSTQLSYWNGAGWTTYSYSAATGNWTLSGNIVNNTNLPPGMGFFLFNGTKAWTNTFIGNVAANSGSTVTNSLITGYSPVGSVVPFADSLTNNTTVNLTVAGASQLQIWDQQAQGYDGPFTYSAAQKSWQLSGVNTNLVISPAQGFFLSPKNATNWVQTAP